MAHTGDVIGGAWVAGAHVPARQLLSDVGGGEGGGLIATFRTVTFPDWSGQSLSYPPRGGMGPLPSVVMVQIEKKYVRIHHPFGQILIPGGGWDQWVYVYVVWPARFYRVAGHYPPPPG